MDAVNLSFLWLNFPGIAAATGRLRWAAGLYRQMLIEEQRLARAGARRWENARSLRRSLLAEIEARLVREESDDIAIVLAL